MRYCAALLLLLGFSVHGYAQCQSKQLRFSDGSKACMESFEPLTVGIEGRNVAEEAGKAKTHAFAIVAPGSACPATSGWSRNGENDDGRAVEFCEVAAMSKAGGAECKCVAFVPVDGGVRMSQKRFVGVLFKHAFGMIEQARAANPSHAPQYDKLKLGLQGREKLHYERLAGAQVQRK